MKLKSEKKMFMTDILFLFYPFLKFLNNIVSMAYGHWSFPFALKEFQLHWGLGCFRMIFKVYKCLLETFKK